MERRFACKALVLVLIEFVFWSMRSSGGELPVESFFRNYEYAQVRISPDGTRLAALAPIKNRVGLAIINLDGRKANWAYAHRGADIRWFTWANTNRLLFSYSKNGYAISGLMAVDHDGKHAKELLDIGDSRERFLALLPNSPDEILIQSEVNSRGEGYYRRWGYRWIRRFPDVYRVNINTGSRKRVVKNPGHVFEWLVDHKGSVRVGVAEDEESIKVLYRADANASWENIAMFKPTGDGVEPMAFDFDNQTLFVRLNAGEPTGGVYRFDPATKSLKDLAFRHAAVDVDALLLSEERQSVVGVTYETERPEVFWFDADRKRLQASVDRALTNTLNRVVSISRDERRAIIWAGSDRSPGTYYVLDVTTSKMEKLADMASWIDPAQMATMSPIEYKSRDGLTIHGYLTLPVGSSGKNLPLIVNPHGGPNMRDTWGFDPEVQFFANRGYAVLRMNFRGSSGYGSDFLRAGYRQWGLKQQDDITDGVRWAIDQGIADPKRIGIFGVSYGGYAAMMGLAKTPELYRCGISHAGVTDVARMLEFSIPTIQLIKSTTTELVGDPKTEKEFLKEISPLSHVDKIRVPVFLAYGALDPKVPLSNGRDLAQALKRRRVPCELMVKNDEGHGFARESNRIELWKRIDAFLKANMN